HVLSLPLSAPTALIAFADAAREEASTEQSIGTRWNGHLFLPHPYVHKAQTLQLACANRNTAAQLSKRNRPAALGTPVAKANGSRNHKVLTTRYRAEKGSGYGQLKQRHPFCASKFITAPRLHRDRATDPGARDRYQCGSVLRC